MADKLPRYTPVLVADPAAEAPAPVAAGLEGALIDKARRLGACNIADIDPARVAELEAENAALEAAALRGAADTPEGVMLARVVALEAERDRLALEVAALRAEAERVRSLLPYPSVLDEAGFIVRRAGYGPMADSLQTWGACIRGFYEREARGE